MIELFLKGGPVMFVLLALSIYAVAVILFKTWQFVACRVLDNSFADEILALIKSGDTKTALTYLDSLNNPQAAILAGCIRAAQNPNFTRETRDMEVSRVASSTFAKLEAHMKGLELTASSAPLLGLLGTVIGMIVAFSVIEDAGSRVTPSLLAGGIWQELINTVGGLIVAIPALFAFHIFDGIIGKSRQLAQDSCIRALTIFEERNAKQATSKISQTPENQQEKVTLKSRLFGTNAI